MPIIWQAILTGAADGSIIQPMLPDATDTVTRILRHTFPVVINGVARREVKASMFPGLRGLAMKVREDLTMREYLVLTPKGEAARKRAMINT